MSFAFSYVARTKQRAIELAQSQLTYPSVPPNVVGFIVAAIEAIPADDSTKLISVMTDGHLGDGSYNISTCKIEVKLITVAE